MPTYVYHCTNCKQQLEVKQSYNAVSLTECPNCQQPTLHRIIQLVPIHYKGDGFYKTDNAKNNAPSA